MNKDSKAIIELHRRLDEWQHLVTLIHSDPDTVVVSAVRTLGRITNGYFPVEYGEPLRISARVADEIVNSSPIVSKLIREFPSLKTYSSDTAQLWVGSKPIGPHVFDKTKDMLFYQAKPFGLGIYTSSMLHPPATSMWKLYLENYGEKLFPKPWTTYQLTVKPEAKVYDVTSAEQWVNLVKEHPLQKGSIIYPDWLSIARQYDGVHLSLPAVTAIQGYRLQLGDLEVAESYWDVETTLWFSWSFNEALLITG
jgi:hypothetical protein